MKGPPIDQGPRYQPTCVLVSGVNRPDAAPLLRSTRRSKTSAQRHCQRLAFFWTFLAAAPAPAPLKFLALSFFCRIFSALLIFDLALMPACPGRAV